MKPTSTKPETTPAVVQDEYTWRNWMFGDWHADTHKFVGRISERAPKEIACAFAASFLVSPIVGVIDKCIAQDVSGSQQFMNAIKAESKKLFTQPKQFFGSLSFRLTFVVYFGTYAVANLSELFNDTYRIRDDEQRKTIKVGASAVANIGLLAWRDSVFAREFSSAPKRPTPMRTIGLFAARDASTMYATFYLAPRAAEYLQEEHDVEKNVAELGCALAIPAAVQVVTAPLHIHAMDFYAKPKVENGWADRMAAIRGEFKTVAAARSLRILPAFGIGSFSNNRFRDLLIRHQGENESRLQTHVTAMVQRARTNMQS